MASLVVGHALGRPVILQVHVSSQDQQALLVGGVFLFLFPSVSFFRRPP